MLRADGVCVCVCVALGGVAFALGPLRLGLCAWLGLRGLGPGAGPPAIDRRSRFPVPGACIHDV